MRFEPVSYDHAAGLIGERPWDVSRDAELLAAAHLAALNKYNYNIAVVGLDIYNVEAEIYGCEIEDPGGNEVPSASAPPLNDVRDILSLDLDPSRDGRIPMILEAATKIREKKPDAEVRIPLSGPFTIACHLLGMEDTICELFTNPESTEKVLMHLAENQLAYRRAARSRGFQISLFESSVTPPILSPEVFSRRVAPALEVILHDPQDKSGPQCQFIIGGDTVHILDAILSLPASYIICPVETDQELFMSRVEDSIDRHVRINMEPSVFLSGKYDRAKIEAQRVSDIAKNYGNTSVGALMPFDADTELVRQIADYFEFR